MAAPNNMVRSVDAGEDDTVAAGTTEGLSVFDDQEWTTYTEADGLAQPGGRLWTWPENEVTERSSPQRMAGCHPAGCVRRKKFFCGWSDGRCPRRERPLHRLSGCFHSPVQRPRWR